ncbi:unnamed protein product [Rangifer tarandus platyrhynchus]|uniref:Uncharacterized protein n=2 Tax=Rangifer tarandus platyrhynchus TaxID=3082113 RepID=A0ABN8ZKZ7_RANTA|nr:unnamed protein product [Rangifer tarandus platyrhynchus]CAI9708658.1 unnamed protein product [Rangifer tarandus platyrhynchus]
MSRGPQHSLTGTVVSCPLHHAVPRDLAIAQGAGISEGLGGTKRHIREETPRATPTVGSVGELQEGGSYALFARVPLAEVVLGRKGCDPEVVLGRKGCDLS